MFVQDPLNRLWVALRRHLHQPQTTDRVRSRLDLAPHQFREHLVWVPKVDFGQIPALGLVLASLDQAQSQCRQAWIGLWLSR